MKNSRKKLLWAVFSLVIIIISSLTSYIIYSNFIVPTIKEEENLRNFRFESIFLFEDRLNRTGIKAIFRNIGDRPLLIRSVSLDGGEVTRGFILNAWSNRILRILLPYTPTINETHNLSIDIIVSTLFGSRTIMLNKTLNPTSFLKDNHIPLAHVLSNKTSLEIAQNLAKSLNDSLVDQGSSESSPYTEERVYKTAKGGTIVVRFISGTFHYVQGYNQELDFTGFDLQRKIEVSKKLLIKFGLPLDRNELIQSDSSWVGFTQTLNGSEVSGETDGTTTATATVSFHNSGSTQIWINQWFDLPDNIQILVDDEIAIQNAKEYITLQSKQDERVKPYGDDIEIGRVVGYAIVDEMVVLIVDVGREGFDIFKVYVDALNGIPVGWVWAFHTI